MSYVAIYRKFRPQTFGQVKDQDAITRTLKNQIKSRRMGHAYLFTGTRGTGKTTVARIFAKAINCLNPVDGEPCNECGNCRAITNGSFMDVVELDAATNNGVEEIRRVVDEVQYTPVSGKYKVYILDEAHMLTPSAANAFLKTLEEPPEYAVFILATTEPNKLPVTILSRCQRYDFKRIRTKKIVENIKECLSQEGLEAEEKAVLYIAHAGDGSMRDSLSLLDKAIAFNPDKKLTYKNTLEALGTVDTISFSRMFRSVAGGDTRAAIEELDSGVRSGKDLSQYINDFVWYIRNLLMVNIGADKDLSLLGISEENLKLLKEDAKLVPEEILTRYIRILSELVNSLKFTNSRQVLAEVAIIKLARPQMETDNEAILDRIRQLEALAAGGLSAGMSTGEPVQRVPALNMVQQKAAQAPQPEAAYAPMREPAYDPGSTEAPQDYMYMDNLSGIQDIPDEQNITGNAHIGHPVHAGGDKTPSQTVCSRWADVLKGLTPLLKIHLKNAQVRASGDNSVEITADKLVAYDSIEANKQKLKSIIKDITGQDIGLIIKPGQENGSSDTPVDEDDEDMAIQYVPEEPEIDEIQALLEANVGMKIETEDA